MSERPVLIATKLDQRSDAVVEAGLSLARTLGAPIRLIHAYRLPVVADSQTAPSGVTFDLIEAGLRQSLEEQLRRLGASPEEIAGLDLEAGPISRVLEVRARQEDALLSVVGCDAGTFPRRARHILRRASRPVLVVRPGLNLPFARILAPIDLSPLSADAFRCGLGLIKQLERQYPPSVRALFVVNPLERVGSMHFSPQQIDRFVDAELEGFVGRYSTEWPSLESKILNGQARPGILQEAKDWQADLILMGTHGRTGFERVVLGSVTEEIVRRAPCHLLVIPPDAAFKAALAAEQPDEDEGEGPEVGDRAEPAQSEAAAGG